ncbi:phosphoribosylaminoimidazolesuccinocarboxamide synthase [Pontimonas sp.]|nr:phosphoribosylaminoimidazolesuccinocarboxamide synthase [Pontimonas sp.]
MTFLSDWKPVYSGKVRELYIPVSASKIGDAEKLLVVATDRVSAFDHILEPEIPGKGELLTQLTLWWFRQFPDIPNHLRDEPAPEDYSGNAMVVEPLDMFPVECVVRGYLCGSGWKEYQRDGSVCGIALPEGLNEGDRLPEPIYTPATKAAVGDHDENITYEQTEDLLGPEDAAALRQLSLDLYMRAASMCEKREVILADTKFEWGKNTVTGAITLGDEVLTSDSSRYWDGEIYSQGGINRLDSFDKQIVRTWLSDNWDFTGNPPRLPAELVEKTKARYDELLARFTAN